MTLRISNKNRTTFAKAASLSLLTSLLVSLPWSVTQPANATLNPGAITFNDGICDLPAAGYLGDGSIASRFIISDSESLWESADCSFEGNQPGHFFVVNDIDASEALPGTPTQSPIGYLSPGAAFMFSGVIEGLHHSISVSMTSDYSVGLFANLSSAIIKDLTLRGSYTRTGGTGNDGSFLAGAGAMAVRSDGAVELIGIQNYAEVHGRQYVGGLVGSASLPFGAINTLLIRESQNHATVTGNRAVGGMVGLAYGQVNLREVTNSGNVTAVVDSAGGFVGICGELSSYRATNLAYISAATIVGGVVGGCSQLVQMNTTQNRGPVSGGDYTGGLVGEVSGNLDIENSSNQAAVIGRYFTGGLAGFASSNAVILHAINSGPISGTAAVGGLIGFLSVSADVRFSLNQSVVSGMDSVGGFIGLSGTTGVAPWAVTQIQDSENRGDVSSVNAVGGFVGFAHNFLNLRLVTNSGAVDAQLQGSLGGSRAGGLIGKASASQLARSVNLGPVRGARAIGGLIGQTTANCLISGVTNDGPITAGGSRVGGLIGEALGDVYVIHSLNTGRIIGVDETGGFIGYVSLFGWIESSVNLGNVNGLNSVGGFIGELSSLRGGFIQHVSNSGNIVGQNSVGGIGGELDSDMDFRNVSNTGDVVGGVGVGGIGGYFDAGVTFSNVLNAGMVSGAVNVGGIAGDTDGPNLLFQVQNNGGVVGTTSVGGIVGWLGGVSTVSRVVNTRNVNGGNQIGGIFGFVSQDLALDDSANLGSIFGMEKVGGLVGRASMNFPTRLKNNFNSGQVVGSSDFDGLVGTSSETIVVTSNLSSMASRYVAVSTPAQLQVSLTFTGWDFQGVWGFRACQVSELPVLRFTSPAGPFSDTSCVLVTAVTEPEAETSSSSSATVSESVELEPVKPPSTPTAIVHGLSTRILTELGGELIVFGRQLQRVDLVTLGGLSVSIIANTPRELKLQIGEMPAGVWDLVFTGPNGHTRVIRAVRITQVVSKP